MQGTARNTRAFLSLFALGLAFAWTAGCLPERDNPWDNKGTHPPKADQRATDGPWVPDRRTDKANLTDSSRDKLIGQDGLRDVGPLPDKGPPDLAQVLDIKGPDKTLVGEMKLPDKAMPDKALPDKAMPDKAMPDKPIPDKLSPDQSGCTQPTATNACATDVWGFKWCPIQPGCFLMGSPSTEACRQSIETQHQVTLTRKFLMLETEVTQGQFLARMGYNPSKYTTCGSTCPVESITWSEAAAFANAVSQLLGLAKCYTCTGTGSSVSCTQSPSYTGAAIYSCPGIRLPTEAEWEYAYRAGTSTPFYSGGITSSSCSSCTVKDTVLDTMGWYCANATSTKPVGGKAVNGWGLKDMAGNVMELCEDAYATYVSTPLVDPVGTGSTSRVGRGGCFIAKSPDCRAAFRLSTPANPKSDWLGFRVVKTLP